MIANVQLIDGRVFQFASRGDATKVLEGQPGSDEVKVRAWLRAKDGEPFKPLRVSYLRKASVTSIVDAEDEAEFPDELPAQGERDRRLQAYRDREGAQGASNGETATASRSV